MTDVGYQVLARKYRPQTFHDVVGQDSVVQTLVRALTSGRIAHAFLFTGSRGVGKTTLARILARCLTCEKGPTGTPCGTCRMCTAITGGQAVDVVEIDGASNNGVEQVRDLQEMARFLPQMARFKIFIIDEVHMLSSGAFNALLKTLEEPPPHLKFIFATTEPHKIPVTILSRCQRYDFRRIPSATMVQRLKVVLDAEKLKIDDDGLQIIARAAEGGMRDALSLADQVLSFAGAIENVAISSAQVTEALGLIDRRTIAAAVDAVLAGDARAALTIIEGAFLRGFDLKQLLSLVAEELRHISVSQACGTILGFADLADDDVGRIDARAKTTDPKDALRLLGMALDGIDVVAKAEDARLALELVLLRMCRRAPIGDAMLISEALVRLERLSKGQPVPPLIERPASTSTTPLGIAAQAFPRVEPLPVSRPLPAPTTTTAAVPAPAPAPASVLAVVPRPPAAIENADGEDEPVITQPTIAPQAAAEENPDDDDDDDGEAAAAPPAVIEIAPIAAAVEEEDDDVDPLAGFELPGVDPRWRTFVQTLQKQRMGIFRLGRLKGVANDVVDVCFGTAHAIDEASRMATEPEVLARLEKAFGKKLKLAVLREDAGAISLHDAEEALKRELQQKLEAHAKAHPVVQKALALFGGEVRAVRRV
ncbi:MAG: DNA polymerase III subunit gamma/tau [Deltaproteobacteria bacterium]|nr:DNA polymerase III subunit gamma/tau [Deltaproteobacteria bacterium]